jgi:hypothetical protein
MREKIFYKKITPTYARVKFGHLVTKYDKAFIYAVKIGDRLWSPTVTTVT